VVARALVVAAWRIVIEDTEVGCRLEPQVVRQAGVNPRRVEDSRVDRLAQESALNSIGYTLSISEEESEPAGLSPAWVLVRLPTRRGSMS
jgi:hypothetical protein